MSLRQQSIRSIGSSDQPLILGPSNDDTFACIMYAVAFGEYTVDFLLHVQDSLTQQ